MQNKQGFTLVELMVVIVIIGLLTLISYPFYGEYIHKSRRVDAMNSLLSYQLEQEKYRSHHVQYAPDFEALTGVDLTEIVSSGGYYDLSIGEVSATTYRLFAEPKGNQTADTRCGIFAINQNGPDFSTGYANASCWNQR